LILLFISPLANCTVSAKHVLLEEESDKRIIFLGWYVLFEIDISASLRMIRFVLELFHNCVP